MKFTASDANLKSEGAICGRYFGKDCKQLRHLARVMFEYTIDKTRRNNVETEWDTGFFIGINSRTTEYLIAKGSGVFSTTAIRRHQDDKAYDHEILTEVGILNRDS